MVTGAGRHHHQHIPLAQALVACSEVALGRAILPRMAYGAPGESGTLYGDGAGRADLTGRPALVSVSARPRGRHGASVTDRAPGQQPGRALGRLRPLGVLVTGLAWILLAAAPVLADNGPHTAADNSGVNGIATDSCAGCHRAHTAKGANLLAEASETALCYTCHGRTGTGATTNVQDGQQYEALDGSIPGPVAGVVRGTTLAGALRGGGFDAAAIGTLPALLGDPIGPLVDPVATTSRHDVGTTATAWGRGDISAGAVAGNPIALTCGSCHNPHGNSRYRVLNPTPVGAYTGAYTGIAAGTADDRPSMSNVDIADATAYTYTTTDYWGPADPFAPGYIAGVSEWCASCHTRYLAGPGAGSASSGDATFTFRHATTGTAASIDGTEVPSCVQCHVSHGSNAAMGTNSRAVPLPDGTSRALMPSSLLRIDNRGICVKCHHK
jgi:predicted CXXCH cytochrome family protein